MNILALDLGTHTGWALSDRGRIESGVQVFDVKRGESPGMRYVRFNRWLGEFNFSYADGVPDKLHLVVYEQTHHRGGAATETAAGFATRVQEEAARWNVDHAAIHSATLKKWTTGSGRGDKAAMRLWAVRKGWCDDKDRTDENEVDAVCLLQYALAELIARAPSASPVGVEPRG